VLLAINVVFGFLISGIDWRAHAGGFLVGGAVAAVLVYAPRARRNAVQAAGLALVAVLVSGRSAYGRRRSTSGSSRARRTRRGADRLPERTLTRRA
jgi:hypothetical protein